MNARLCTRIAAVLCYLGAMRVPVVALAMPGWAFTLPGGLFAAGAAWLYGRRRSTFLLHHAREGLRWSLQANLMLAAIALLSRLLHLLWLKTALSPMHTLWYFSATIFRWAGILISILTAVVMYRAAQGRTEDALALPH